MPMQKLQRSLVPLEHVLSMFLWKNALTFISGLPIPRDFGPKYSEGVLLTAVRDRRSLVTLCNLKRPLSLLVFFLLFDEECDRIGTQSSSHSLPLNP